jgi:SNF2 family DNA or RNA helicase
LSLEGESLTESEINAILPASLIANWRSEIQKFAPALGVFYAHPAETPNEALAAAAKSPVEALGGKDLVITSYSMAVRLAWLKATTWNLVILDEAQAIKNAGARPSRAVKELPCRHRVALSGTPIENRLSDLWSLFDFLCPGLLGGAKDFAAFVKSRSAEDQSHFAPLRRLVRPYILRRLKSGNWLHLQCVETQWVEEARAVVDTILVLMSCSNAGPRVAFGIGSQANSSL